MAEFFYAWQVRHATSNDWVWASERIYTREAARKTGEELIWIVPATDDLRLVFVTESMEIDKVAA